MRRWLWQLRFAWHGFNRLTHGHWDFNVWWDMAEASYEANQDYGTDYTPEESAEEELSCMSM